MNKIAGNQHEYFQKPTISKLEAEISEKNKLWKSFKSTKKNSKFLLHPRQIASDSECSLYSPSKNHSPDINGNLSNYPPGAHLVEEVNISVALKTNPKIVSKTIKVVENNNNNNNNEPIIFEPEPIDEDINGKKLATSPPAVLNKAEKNVVSATEKQHVTIQNEIHAKRPYPRIDAQSARKYLCESEFQKKFRIIIEKSLNIINGTRLLLERGIPPPDGEEDHCRRRKRVQEFASRFSRIYLYPLVRQTNELNNLDRSNPPGSVNYKLIMAYQTLLQGLQAYHAHLPCSIGKSASDKLQLLIEQALILIQLQEELKQNSDEDFEFINSMRYHSENILDTIKQFETKIEVKQSKRNTRKQLLLLSKRLPSKVIKNQTRFSMYTTSACFRKDLPWKRTVEALAKKKFNVKSRYKTATYKHRPPVEKPHIVDLPPKTKLFTKLSSELLRNTPLTTPISEDNIETMVEIDNEKDMNEDQSETPANESENVAVNHNTSLERLLTLARDSNLDLEEGDGGLKKVVQFLRRHLGGRREENFLATAADNQTKDKNNRASEDDKKVKEKSQQKIKNKKE